MEQLAEASPGSTAEYRLCLLESLAKVDASTDWHVVSEKLEALDLCAMAAQLKADHLMLRGREGDDEWVNTTCG